MENKHKDKFDDNDEGIEDILQEKWNVCFETTCYMMKDKLWLMRSGMQRTKLNEDFVTRKINSVMIKKLNK